MQNQFAESFTDEFLIETGTKELRVCFDKISVPSARIDVLRLVMLNITQSVALGYYEDQTSKLLGERNRFTQTLEEKGRFKITGKKLKQ